MPPRASRDVEVGAYRVTVAPGLLGRVGEIARERAPAHRYAIVTDDQVGPRHAERVAKSFRRGDEPLVITIGAGEAHKTRETWAAVTDALLAAGFGRDSEVDDEGGGVIGDLAGFVDAKFMRCIA